MNTEYINEFDQKESPIVGPGSRLRIAREAIGLTIQQVASCLHLTSQLIRDIENDDYSRAPQPVFMRGYLRSYAKLVDLVGDEIIVAFNEMQLLTEAKPNPSVKLYSDPTPPKKGRFLLGLIVISLLMIFAWIFRIPTQIKSVAEEKWFPIPVVQEHKVSENKPHEEAVIKSIKTAVDRHVSSESKSPQETFTSPLFEG